LLVTLVTLSLELAQDN